MPQDLFKIGEVVTLKSHPLAFQENGEIDSYVNHIPPFMCVKEIHIEKNKQIYSKEIEEAQIADNIKYLCVYFNQHRTIFEEKFIYHEMLVSLKDVTFHREEDGFNEDEMKLIEETANYKPPIYQFGKRVFFKTYKLEKRKKFKRIGHDKKSSTKTFLTHTSPAFVLNGCKINDQKAMYNAKNGELQRQCFEEFFKVLWYNSYQEKFSEGYFPSCFFTDDERIFQNKVPLSDENSTSESSSVQKVLEGEVV